MAWSHGELSPSNVPGERLPAREGDLAKDKLATARGGEVQGIRVFCRGARTHFGIARQGIYSIWQKLDLLKGKHSKFFSTCCCHHLQC